MLWLLGLAEASPGDVIAQVLGIRIPARDVNRILESLGFSVIRNKDGYRVTPPFWRPDVAIPDDVIEELIRVYGYDKLPATTLRGELPESSPNPLQSARERARVIVAGLGFQEVVNYSLITAEEVATFAAPDDTVRAVPLAVTNPVASQHTYLRTSLRGSLLSAYARNRRHEDAAVRLFEVGVEYLPTGSDLPKEWPVLCAVMGGQPHVRWSRPGPDRLDFFDAKGAVEALLDDLGVTGLVEILKWKGFE